jgi:hypothetical protein
LRTRRGEAWDTQKRKEKEEKRDDYADFRSGGQHPNRLKPFLAGSFGRRHLIAGEKKSISTEIPAFE